VAIILALAHFIWPDLTIDAITIALVIIAISPWLAPLFKTIEFPGGWKIEFQDVQNIKNDAKEAGLLTPVNELNKPEYSYQLVADQDPNLALAGLRIEIEKRLIRIAEVNNIFTSKPSVGQLLQLLSAHNILTGNERDVLMEITRLLNSAVHGASVDNQTAELALEMGSRLLEALDKKINDKKVEK
jgi:hypothetical protein